MPEEIGILGLPQQRQGALLVSQGIVDLDLGQIAQFCHVQKGWLHPAHPIQRLPHIQTAAISKLLGQFFSVDSQVIVVFQFH